MQRLAVDPWTRVVMLGLAQLLCAAALWFAVVGSKSPALASPHVPWWVLAVAFALAELCFFHVKVRRQSLMVNLGEIPLVLGLFYSFPIEIVVGHVIGAMAAHVVVLRHTPLKAAFNATI